ncbi:hypothetical protein PF008_g3766 [Phytophthora fragariae]|uniref:Sodium channel protein n=1 Tax=Phytophthora fragariae TaxID=53985 RepID=A0A6G0SDY6_9STRA|nr:hypothetical protein PF008_g3766 [Phytophthora fragariae]
MIGRAFASIGNFGVLLFLFIYIFALMGMQFFGNTMRFDDQGYPTPHTVDAFWNGTVPRSNFDTLPWAIATVFQVITGDNWSAVLYDAIRGNGMIASLYFIILVMLGDFVLMNLFLALLLDNFATRSEHSTTEIQAKSPGVLIKRRSKISPIEANKQRIIRRMVVAQLTSQYVCECWGAAWKPVLSKNFDNVGSAMLTFFILSTSENWSEIMKAACNATSPGMQPIVNHNEVWIVFFIAFMVVGSFFVMNVFVGVIIDNFNTMKAKLGGDFLLTPEQKKWMEAQKIAKRVGPIRILKVPAQPVRRICFSIVRNHYFEGFIMTCIVANALLMAAQHFGESTQQLKTTYVVSELSTVIFALEAAMKLMAYGRAYFDDNWNRFDFSVVVGTVICTVVQVLVANSIWTLTMLVHLMRVTRIFRLVESSSSIRAILSTLYIALPGLSNISSILFLILFVYGTVGVHLFAKVALSSDIDAHANFQTFGRSILFLLRVATGESWDHCMYDLASNVPGCVNDPPYDPNMCGFGNIEGCIPLNGCGNPVAYLFFCSFTVIVAYVMLNLTVAVVLESFATCQEEEEDSMLVPELLEEFQYKWAELDPMATGFIKVDKLLTFVHKVAPPLGWFGIQLQMPQFFRYTRSLHLPLYEGELVQFRDVVMAMTREMINTTNNWALTDESKLGDDVKKTGGASNRKPTEFYAHEYFAARYLQRRVQNWLVRKRQLEKKKTRDFIRKMKKQSKKPRKDKKHGETLVLPMVKRVPNALQEASRHF